MRFVRAAWFRARRVFEIVRRPGVRGARRLLSTARAARHRVRHAYKRARRAAEPHTDRAWRLEKTTRKRIRDGVRPVTRLVRHLYRRTVHPVIRYIRKYSWKFWKRARKRTGWLLYWVLRGYVNAISGILRLAISAITRLPLLPPHVRWGLSLGAARIAQLGLPRHLPLRVHAPPQYGEVHGIHLKERDRSYERSYKGPWGRLRYQQALEEGQTKKREMWKAYSALAHKVALDVPYVYVALHFQPERTTSSLGGVFGDQYLVVDMLARTIPPGWKVYVKEHPSQFYPPFAGERSRHSDLYRDLLDLPNVELVSLTTSTFQLIDHAQAVATVTGTVGWEAIIRGKPALIFGSAWYRHCDGVFFVPAEPQMREALERIQAGFRPDPRRIRLFMQALDRTCARAGLGYNTPDEQELDAPLDDSVRRLTTVLQDYWAHMQSHPLPAQARLEHAGLSVAGEP